VLQEFALRAPSARGAAWVVHPHRHRQEPLTMSPTCEQPIRRLDW